MSEAAEALGISESTVRRRIHRGKLVGRREPYGHSFRWLVRFPCEVDEPRGNLRLVPAPPKDSALPPSLSDSTRLIASLGRSDATEVDAAPPAQQASSMQELASPPQESESASTLRSVPSASTRLIASLDRDDTDEQVAQEPAAPAGSAQPEQASRRAFWLAVVVVAVALGTLALGPPAWSRGVAIAVAALAAIMAMGEGAVGLWQAGSGEAERE